MTTENTLESLLNKVLKEHVTNGYFKEYINFQPDMLDRTNLLNKAGQFNVNGEKVDVKQNGGSYQYIFGPKMGDYIKKLYDSGKDDTEVALELGKMYLDDNNELRNILDLADRSDTLVFNTSNGEPIDVKVSDVFWTLAYLKRDQRWKEEHQVNEASEDRWKEIDSEEDDPYADDVYWAKKYRAAKQNNMEDEGEEDWLEMWKDSRIEGFDDDEDINPLNYVSGY